MTTARAFAMIWRPWLGPLQLKLAHRLMDEGWTGVLYVPRAEYIPGVERVGSTSRFVRVVPFQLLYDVAMQPVLDEAGEIKRARALEMRLGLTFGELMVTDRHLGRGFALGGSKFPTSGSSRASLGQAYAAISTQLEFWIGEFSSIGVSLVLDADVFAEKAAYAVGAQVRSFTASRHADYFYFAHDAIMRTPMLKAAYSSLPNGAIASSGIVQAKAVQDYFKTAYRDAKAFNVLRSSALRTARKFYGRLKGRSSTGGYDLLSEIAYEWRRRAQIKRMTASPTVSLQSLQNRKFVYFPLATEPEVTLQVLSQQYFFQLETIAALARDLPADVLLVTKEHHPACGARSSGFYDQILSFKNLRMLDLRTPGLDVVRQANVVVTISGSAGFEAATMGKPTIVLGRNNLYDFLPHVRVVKDIALLRDSLNDALEGRLAGPNAAADGHKFLRAMEEISFRATEFVAHNQAIVVSSELGESLYSCLMRSLHFSSDSDPDRFTNSKSFGVSA